MAVSQQRRELIGRELVQCQAAFIFVSLRQAILNLPSKSAHIESHDARQAMEVLAKAAHEFLTELSNFLRSALIQAGWKRPASGAEIQRAQAKAKARRASKTGDDAQIAR